MQEKNDMQLRWELPLLQVLYHYLYCSQYIYTYDYNHKESFNSLAIINALDLVIFLFMYLLLNPVERTGLKILYDHNVPTT